MQLYRKAGRELLQTNTCAKSIYKHYINEKSKQKGKLYYAKKEIEM